MQNVRHEQPEKKGEKAKESEQLPPVGSMPLLSQAIEIIVDLYDDSDCIFDHHGYCQTHGWMTTEPICPMARARKFLNDIV